MIEALVDHAWDECFVWAFKDNLDPAIFIRHIMLLIVVGRE